MIELNHICYQYDHVDMAFNFNIDVNERVVIIGPSGAGKSTLLSLIAGFIAPVSGDIILNNKSMKNTAPGQRPVSMLFQENNLFSHLTVLQNITLGIKPSLKITLLEHKQIMDILVKVGLDNYEKRYPHQLSGGQRQRVALARCLIQHRPILLLDEPFSALDQALRYEMLDLVEHVCKEFNLTLMMVSHYLDKTLDCFTRCLVINNGKIIFNQSPSKLYQHNYQDVANILGLIK